MRFWHLRFEKRLHVGWAGDDVAVKRDVGDQRVCGRWMDIEGRDKSAVSIEGAVVDIREEVSHL